MIADVDEALRREAVRLFRRYQVELVEAFELCPWAEVARKQGAVAERVVASSVPTVGEVHAAIDDLASHEHVEIGILLFPRWRESRSEFERFVASVREEEAARRRPETAPFAMAEFHPDAPALLEPPGVFTNFVRRTPDATVQLVRHSALARVRKGERGHGTGFFDLSTVGSIAELVRVLQAPSGPPLYERVHAHNRATFEAHGADRMHELFQSLRDDRDRTYRALGVAT